MAPSWYHNAAMYAVDVRRFMDSNGDGIGDFPGLISRLDYIGGLGVTCLWLLPFFPSPYRDGGYDVTDYYHVDPAVGTHDDFLTLCHRAGEMGIRILVDIPANHTSDEHPWFQAARRDAGSRFGAYYTWSDAPPPEPPQGGPIVGNINGPTWTYDEVAGAYYYHRFYDFQPDLNLNNEEVREEIVRILDFWLSLGASGFRLDAVPIMIGTEGPPTELPEAPHTLLKHIRRHLESHRSDVMLLGEVDVAPEELVHYFGDDDELHMLFNFLLNNYLYLALARENREPIVRALHQLPEPPSSGQWANFLRNLDELDLEQLTPADREEVWERFAPEPEMRIYNRGLRRRLAPILAGDRRRQELAFSLLLSLPGVPVIVYGDEIGMGDDLSQEGRMSVRPPMQWSDAPNGGFSSAEAAQLIQPAIKQGPFGYPRVNVAAQREDDGSLLAWLRHMMSLRRQCIEFASGIWQVFDIDTEAVIAHRSTWRDGTVIAVHNLSGSHETVTLNLRDQRSRQLMDLIKEDTPKALENGMFEVELEPYGYRWYRVLGERMP